MATDHSSDATRAVADALGATYHEGNVQHALEQTHATVERMTGVDLDWSNPDHDLPLQNYSRAGTCLRGWW
jgi:hypothetical protein